MRSRKKRPKYPNLAAEIAREGISTQELADAVSVCPSSICHWLSGRSTPSIETAKRVAKYFDVDVSYLFSL